MDATCPWPPRRRTARRRAWSRGSSAHVAAICGAAISRASAAAARIARARAGRGAPAAVVAERRGRRSGARPRPRSAARPRARRPAARGRTTTAIPAIARRGTRPVAAGRHDARDRGEHERRQGEGEPGVVEAPGGDEHARQRERVSRHLRRGAATRPPRAPSAAPRRRRAPRPARSASRTRRRAAAAGTGACPGRRCRSSGCRPAAARTTGTGCRNGNSPAVDLRRRGHPRRAGGSSPRPGRSPRPARGPAARGRARTARAASAARHRGGPASAAVSRRAPRVTQANSADVDQRDRRSPRSGSRCARPADRPPRPDRRPAPARGPRGRGRGPG